MSKTRNPLARVLATALTATWLVIATGAASAWAGPMPLQPEGAANGPGAPPAAPPAASSDGFVSWQLASVTTIGIALAVLVTYLVAHATSTRRHRGRPAHA
jgi:hypothetical protein